MEISSQNSLAVDGWERLEDSTEQEVQLISLYKQNQGRAILQEQYSLEPDMATGWMPKLPSCPIPLTYQNPTINAIIPRVEASDVFQIVYRGPRHINSVQLHKSNPYLWKYRQKYEVKVGVIEQAISKVGKEEGQPLLRQELELPQKPEVLQRKSEVAFSSEFQSGNLDLAIRIKKNEYDCFMRSDTNTKGHTNWYYFRVSNRKHTGPIQFNIPNIVKHRNLYGQGMTPYSCQDFTGDQHTRHAQWRQNRCFDVAFVERLCRYGGTRVTNHLQFKYDFKYEDMDVYFAYSIPYTYSYLQSFVDSLRTNPLVTVASLCQSFSGLDLPLLQISKQQPTAKTSIIIAARIHPGQTNSSHMLQGVIRTLLEDTQVAARLLACCNFYVVPMINPDGVVAGNYRTSFSGRDLNRKFNELGKFLYPEINGLTNLVKKLKSQHKKVQFFLDFHSHSSKKDLFCYGPEHKQGSFHFYRSRLFSKILQKQDCMFDYKKCVYSISEYKKYTARAHMLFHQHIPMTYTFEVSNGLYKLGKDVQAAFDRQALLRAGKIVVNGLAEYVSTYLKEYYSPGLYKSAIKSRKSLPSFKRSAHNMRKSVGFGNNGSCVEFLREEEMKGLVEDIIKEKENKLKEIDFGSDSQSSQNDIEEHELQEIFQQRSKFALEAKSAHNLSHNHPRHKKRRLSLSKFTNKHELLKKSYKSSAHQVIALEGHQKKKAGAQGSLKVKKSRIYYEQTHPPASKKSSENLLQPKKTLKQKKFPILF